MHDWFQVWHELPERTRVRRRREGRIESEKEGGRGRDDDFCARVEPKEGIAE